MFALILFDRLVLGDMNDGFREPLHSLEGCHVFLRGRLTFRRLLLLWHLRLPLFCLGFTSRFLRSRRSEIRGGQFVEGQTLADDLTNNAHEATCIVVLPVVVTEYLFVQIAKQVERLDADVGAIDAALEQRPEVFKAVGVHVLTRVALRMVNDVVDVMLIQPVIRQERVGVHGRAMLDVRVDVRLQVLGASALHNLQANGGVLAVALKQTHNRDLCAHASAFDNALALADVHVARLAADVGLIYLDFAVHLAEAFSLHGKTDTVKHEPRGLLSDAKRARQLVRRNAVLAVRKHPDRRKPLVQTKRRVLEDRSDLNGILLLTRLALPYATCGQERLLFARTLRTHWTIRPAQIRYERKRNVRIGEVSNRFEKCGRDFGLLAHGMQFTPLGQVSQVYCCPIKPKHERLTLATLFDNYIENRTRGKCPRGQSHDRACAEMFLRFFGANKEPHTLRIQEWDRFIRERRDGFMIPNTRKSNRGRRPNSNTPRKVGNRAIEKDLKWLLAVLNWATVARNERGETLLERNPLKGLKVPKEKSPTRPIVTQDEYDRLLTAAHALGWRHELMLILAHETGHRRGAIARLEWEHVDLKVGRIDWPQHSDKIGMAHSTQLTPAALEALRKAHKGRESLTWIFPSPSDPGQCCADDYVAKWWPEIERKAEIPHRKGLGFHSLRRKFATDLKDAPYKDVLALGGWRNLQTLVTCYQAAPTPQRQLDILLSRSQKVS